MNGVNVFLHLRIFALGLIVISFQTSEMPTAEAQTEAASNANSNDPPLKPTDATEQYVAPSKLVEIADEPKTVDPVQFLPPEVAANVTVHFENQSLRDVFNWIRTERSLDVLVDQRALAAR